MTTERLDNMRVELANYIASLADSTVQYLEIGVRDATLNRDVIIASLLDSVLWTFNLNEDNNPTSGEFTNTLNSLEYQDILVGLNSIYGTNMNYDFEL